MRQARPWEFMVKHTPQREWIEKKGILFWLALFFIELGAGTFIVSAIFGSLRGMLTGWLICGVLGGGFHLLYLGRPLRFWRILLSSGWKTSWISRGLYFVSIFLLLGLLYMVLARWVSPSTGLLTAAGVFAFLTVIYAGFALAYVNGLQLWNSPIIPLIFTVAGIWGGIGLTIATVLAAGSYAFVAATLEVWTRLFLIGFIIIMIVYLLSIRYTGDAGRASVREIVMGGRAPLFWVMVVVLGMAFPLSVALMGWVGGVSASPGLVYAVVLFELLGDLTLRYLILKCAYYEPLVPHRSYA